MASQSLEVKQHQNLSEHLVGSTGTRICRILSDSITERISSFPVAMNSFKIFSFSFPAPNVLAKSSRRMCSGMKERSEIREKLRTAESIASEIRVGGFLIHISMDRALSDSCALSLSTFDLI